MSLDYVCRFVEDVHILTSEKGTPPFEGPSNALPPNGLYVFFEAGQRIAIGSKDYDRIVRIGINKKPDNFQSRIRGHYNGNIRGSVFRSHVGWAILDAKGEKPLEKYGTKRNYKKHNSGGPLEKDISDYFEDAFTFKVFKLDHLKLASYENAMIAAISVYFQYKWLKKELDFEDWLGLHSYSRQNKIMRSGLWNSEGVLLINKLSISDSVRIDEKVISSSKMGMVHEDLARNII